MPPGGTQCCFHLNSAVLSPCEFGCISTTLCSGISFGTSLVDTVCQLSSFLTIVVHIRCQVCVHEPVHALQSPDAFCNPDLFLTCSVARSRALQSSAERVCHFEFARYALSPISSQ